jgi:N-acetylmuramoyl-L-alanine amidase
MPLVAQITTPMPQMREPAESPLPPAVKPPVTGPNASGLKFLEPREIDLDELMMPSGGIPTSQTSDRVEFVGPLYPPLPPRQFIFSKETPKTYGPKKLSFPPLDKKAAETFRVLIDPGHGGIDTGKQALKDGKKVYEKDLTTMVGGKLFSVLKKAGLENVFMTRGYDTDWDLKSHDAIIEKRKERIEQENPDLLLSVHFNSSSLRLVRGQQFFYHHPSSAPLAKALSANSAAAGFSVRQSTQQGFYPINVDPVEFKVDPKHPLNATVKTSAPKRFVGAVLVEGEFMSNQEVLPKLLNEQYQDDLAATFAAGVITALNQKITAVSP